MEPVSSAEAVSLVKKVPSADDRSRPVPRLVVAMIGNGPVEHRLYELMADDRIPAPSGNASATQRMADAISAWRGGNRDASIAETFSSALRETLERQVKDNDIELRKAILQDRSPEVARYRKLIDSDVYRAALQAAKKLGDVAHPGRLNNEPDPARKAQLVALRTAVDDARAGSGSWDTVITRAEALDPTLVKPFSPHAALLAEKQALEKDENVVALLALRNPRRAPPGGAARGQEVEDRVGTALTALCKAMNEAAGDGSYRIERNANVPAALRPADGKHVKGELDFLLMHDKDLVLVGETKAGGAQAVSADGLKFRNAVHAMAERAQPGRTYAFTLGGEKRALLGGGKAKPALLQIAGESLKRLGASVPEASQDAPTNWPAGARYFLPDAVAGIPLSQRAVAYLTWRPGSLAYAQALFEGTEPDANALQSVWQDLLDEPKLAWIWDERALAEQALHAVHGSASVAGFTKAIAEMKISN
ncbi:hypothetical protein [Stenotrophomonas bentonitica]|uniref:hypothetical protein n=1 Tax=Stenotrophomonas bentonitica TaxID=1450134 RepID=UPI00345EB8ED